MKKLIIWTICALTLLLNISATVLALDPAEEIAKLKEQLQNDIGTTSITECQNTLVPVYDLELMEFLRFLELNFQNKSANSSLTNIAIQRYSEFKRNIRQNFNSLQPGLTAYSDPIPNVSDVIAEGLVPLSRLGSGFKGITQDEIAAYQACAQITDSYLDLAKSRMIEQIKNTNAQKRTTMMVEKYQAINTQLRELNSQIARMYGYFMTFKEKLPGFLQECVS